MDLTKIINCRLFYLMAAITSLAILASGCASIASKVNYPVTINSNPSGAEVEVKNSSGMVVFSGKTPTTTILRSGGAYFNKYNYMVTFHKEGYNPTTQNINADIDSTYFGNFLLGGALGMLIIDPITGAMWELPPYASATLSPKSGLAVSPQPNATLQNKKEMENIEKNEIGIISEKLKMLKSLKNDGTITEEEYRLKTKVLIDKL